MVFKEFRNGRVFAAVLFTAYFCMFLLKSEKVFSQEQDSLNFTIDIAIENELKLSHIAQVEREIPLDSVYQGHYLEANQVELDDGYIFLAFGSAPKSICKYDLSGKLVKRITPPADWIKRGMSFSCDTNNNLIYLRGQDNIVYKLDYDGNLIDKQEVPFSAPIFCCNNRIWGISVSHTKKDADIYSLYSGNSTGKYELIKTIEAKIADTDYLNNERPRLRIYPSFSSTNDKMYFSCFFDKTIYVFNNSKLRPFVKFSFANGRPDFTDFIVSPPQFVNGNIVGIGYRLHKKFYSYLYNMGTEERYNLKGAIIIDDIFNTDGVHTKSLANMRNGYFCLLVSSKSIKHTTNKAFNLVIMKLK